MRTLLLMIIYYGDDHVHPQFACDGARAAHHRKTRAAPPKTQSRERAIGIKQT